MNDARIKPRARGVALTVIGGLAAGALALPILAQAAQLVGAEEAVKRAKAAVTGNFKDPLSVQWKNVYLNRRPDGTYVVCGSLNGKNSYGAYTGFRGFIAVVSMEKDPGDAALSEVKRMAKDAETNLANVGKGLREASDVYIDPGDTRAFFEAFQEKCVEGKRTYVK